jgi:hypothetical protein
VVKKEKSKPSGPNLETFGILLFFFSVLLKFMPNPQVLVLIPFLSAPLPITIGRARTKKVKSKKAAHAAFSFRSSPDNYREGSNQKRKIKKGCTRSLFFPLLSR